MGELTIMVMVIGTFVIAGLVLLRGDLYRILLEMAAVRRAIQATMTSEQRNRAHEEAKLDFASGTYKKPWPMA